MDSKRKWVAPTVTPLAAARDAELLGRTTSDSALSRETASS